MNTTGSTPAQAVLGATTKRPRKKAVPVLLDPAGIEALDTARGDTPRSEFIRRAIATYLDKHDK